MTSDEDLLLIAERLSSISEQIEKSSISITIKKIQDCVSTISRSFSGSWIGYHANIYYKEFRPTPPGARFSQEWGLMDLTFINETTGSWVEYDPEKVRNYILHCAGNPSLSEINDYEQQLRNVFEDSQSEIDSILTTVISDNDDKFIEKLKEESQNLEIVSVNDLISAASPSGQIITRDMIALNQGIITPAHISILAEVSIIQYAAKKCLELSKISRRVGSHLSKLKRKSKRNLTIGTSVFIGHGRSIIWRELKDFIHDRLNLPWDEFNRVPVAGVTNIARLSEMLNDAAIAFLIMTAEDEQSDGKIHARQNVIHEAGLFQGRLGFSRAIILLEEGCEEFSNIQGLGQIRFPKNNIKAVFEDVRLVLEREELVEPKKDQDA